MKNNGSKQDISVTWHIVPFQNGQDCSRSEEDDWINTDSSLGSNIY